MKRLFILVSVLFGLMQTADAAEFKPYLGGGVGLASLKLDVTGASAGSGSGSTVGGYGSVGFDFGDYAGAELRVGATGNASLTIGGINYDISSDWLVAYLAKLQFPVTEQFRIYALAGATTTKQTVTIKTPGWIWVATGTAKMSETKTKASLGAGIDFQMSDQLYVGAEFMAYGSGLTMATGNLKYTF